ncbi:MAG: tripartite tricarboxylate transporter substrate binding protein [Chloroflexales bacterium]|nr:tripartite tricarboxylate transporter substrate binding protein [Chloroflexales bacterium]
MALVFLTALIVACGSTPSAENPNATQPPADSSPTDASTDPATPASDSTTANAPLALTAGGFPAKPIQIMAPANPGGGWDQTARLMAQVVQDTQISPVALEVFNVPGAGGTIGLAQLVTQNQGDATTIMVMGRVMIGSILVNQAPVNLEAVTPLARLTAEYEVLAVPADSPYQTLQDLLDDFQANPQDVAWAGGSAGGTDHLLVGQIASATGVESSSINYVAYSGGGEAAAAVIGGQVNVGVSGVGEWIDFVEAGQMRFLAVSSTDRLSNTPDTPTLVESGVDVVLLNWRGVVAPPNIDPEERDWLVQMLTAMNESEAWQQVLETNGWDNVFLTDGLAEYLVEEDATISAILQDIGMTE